MALFSDLLSKLKSLFQPIIGPAIGFFNLVTHTRDTVTGAKDSILMTVQGIVDLVDKVKHFSLDAKFKTRVVNVPKTIEHFNDIVAAVKDIFDKIKEFKAMFREATGQAETADLSEDVQGLEDLEQGVAKLGAKFAQVFEKALGILTFILMIVGNIQKQFDAIGSLVNDINTILDDLDNLDGLFLPQKNKRKTLQLSTGQTIRVRVGNLHG